MGRLYRSRRDRWISGLIGGLGEYFGINTTVLRLIALVSIVFTGGTTIFIYFIAALVVSKEPYPPQDPYYNGGWPGGGYQQPYGSKRRDYYEDPRFSGRPPYGSSNGNAYGTPPQPPQYGAGAPGAPGAGFNAAGASHLDSMMEDIEKKAMKKELEELRKKLSDYEKGEV
ncbi:PspC domain-containing protein [Paenibacillus macerans]|uniref:PspC domain-containing protein n=1 Tax=Paenibacillus macerans TaxID=44252 RepID=UPI003D31CDC4